MKSFTRAALIALALVAGFAMVSPGSAQATPSVKAAEFGGPIGRPFPPGPIPIPIPTSVPTSPA